jgi:NUDIX domain-containing protein
LRRELAEEVGLDDFGLGSLLWTREHEFDLGTRFRGQRERCYLVRVAPFEPASRLDLTVEGVADVRWWTAGEILNSTEVFAPRRLSAVLAEILAHGPPAEPLVVGK